MNKPAAFYQHSLSKFLQYIILKKKKNRFEAEDIMHDIFLRLLEKQDRLRTIDSLENYVFFMIRNQLINERRQDFTRKKALRHLAGHGERLLCSTEQVVLHRELNRHFESSICQLPPKMKQAFEMQDTGVKTEAIADYMCISVPAVKNHLAKAKQKIRMQVAILYYGSHPASRL